MKQILTLIVGIVLGAIATYFVAGASSDFDDTSTSTAAVAAALPQLPEPYYEILYENDTVRIVSHRLSPGASEPEHRHPPMVAYFVEGATLEVTEADGSSRSETVPTGRFVEVPDWWTHSMSNTGQTPLHSILVEFKDRPATGDGD